ncbi:histidine phosphatase family protein [Tunturiibacter gelidoferens]|uniref:Alpha-ribazole phosphatase/probable phosphoglycerate mutase n=1 Tax=Tunturiibacter gelidiferens TaxID=3069689 RepID=A0ACC5P0E4_9BACT|nr:histidine phosphatase family protein [Edaphobacter lichenicola]MBB5340149.1 alpha-ribazole phosphatase/probable phosphoglycerate mutase [Edaphobacter lichenicola]
MSGILFIRHAETDMAGTFCGHSDPEVNARGREQISELINRLREESIEIVYTSDLRRASSTANAIAEAFGVECHVRPTLREINFGTWEGLSWKEIEQRDAVYARQWIAKHPMLAAPDGEAFRHFEQRVLNEVEFLSTKAAEQSIAVVTHAGVLRIVLCSLNNCNQADAWRQTKTYCAIVRQSVALSLRGQVIGAHL